MSILHKIAKWWSNFLKSIRPDTSKQEAELERLEKQIIELQQKEKALEKENVQNTGGRMLTNRGSLKFWLIGFLTFVLAYFIFKTIDILLLIFTAFIVSLAIEAVIEFFQKKLHHRVIAIFLAYLLFILVVLGWLVFIIPFLLNQLSTIVAIVTRHVESIQTLLKTKSIAEIVASTYRIPDWAKHTILTTLSNPTVVAGVQSKLQQNVAQLINLWTAYAKDIWNIAINFLAHFVDLLAQAAIVLTLSVLFSAQKSSVMKFISGLRGPKKYKFAYMKLEKIYKKLWIWLKSQLFLCIFIGVAILLALRILSLCGMNVPQKWSLALIAGLTEIIPYVWALLGVFVAVVVTYTHLGWVGTLIVLAIFVVIQQLKNSVLVPILMNRTLGVNSVIIFISMIIWGLIMGILGILLAVPIAVIITLLFEKTFDE